MDNSNKISEFLNRTFLLLDDYRRGERTAKETGKIMYQITEQATCLVNLGDDCNKFYHIMKMINGLFYELEYFEDERENQKHRILFARDN
jgi:hypothetical protein